MSRWQIKTTDSRTGNLLKAWMTTELSKLTLHNKQ